jgi:hypothetical protein
MIIVPITVEQEITAEEFRKRVGLPEKPNYNIGDIVEVRGAYKTPTPAMVIGMDKRAKGYFYHAATLGRNLTCNTGFSDEEVIRVLDRAKQPTDRSES